MKGKTKFWLSAIFIAVVAIRLFVAFQTENLDYEAYSVLRQVEHIHDTGFPLFDDELSYSGRTQVFSPIYHYLLASFTVFMPTYLVAKIIPNILISLTVLLVFFFALYFIKEETPALFVAALAGLIPLFFNSTVNNASIYTAVIPMFLLTVYFFILTYKDAKYVWSLLFSMVGLTFLHPSSLMLVFCFLIYILLINIENFRKNYRETEIVLFFMFFVFWANITLYKRALLAHGDLVLLQNIPVDIVANSFKDLTFLESIYGIGVIPIIFGLTAIYAAVFVSNSKALMLMTSISIGMFILLWFKLVNFDIGLIFMSLSLIIIASYSIGRTYERMQMIKLQNAHIYFLALLLIVSAATFIPAVIAEKHAAPSSGDVEAFMWLKNNTNPQSVVLALPEEGSALSYYSQRKNVMDDTYILIKNVNQRYYDIQSLYNDRFVTSALEKLNYYSVDYILLSEHNQRKNNRTSLAFANSECFERVYPEDEEMQNSDETEESSITRQITPQIYRVKCELST